MNHDLSSHMVENMVNFCRNRKRLIVKTPLFQTPTGNSSESSDCEFNESFKLVSASAKSEENVVESQLQDTA